MSGTRFYPLPGDRNKAEEAKLTFTAAFIAHLEKSSSAGLKIGIKKVGCNGYAYTFEPFTEMDAIFMDARDVNVGGTKRIRFESEQVAMHLRGSTFDFVREGLNFKTKITNPNVKGTCGCGESFNLA